MERQITALTKQEEEALKKALLDFVPCVSSEEENRWGKEIEILPSIIQLLVNYFATA